MDEWQAGTWSTRKASPQSRLQGALSAYRRGVESTKTLAYDEDDRITRAASTYFEHDALGRRTTQAPSTDFEKDPLRVTYSWSGERLIAQTGPNWSAEHVYDATGQRTRSVVTSGSTETTTTWAYEGIRLTGLDAVRSDTATWSLEYLYDERGTITGGIYSAEDTSRAFLVVATDRGDVRELLDANGDAFAFYSYDAYGNPDETLSRQTGKVPAGLAADIAKRNVLRYAGYCYDEVSGLYYLSQRYYDPASACFVSKDPARADGEESAYQYCAGDPVGSVDPTGMWTMWVYTFSNPKWMAWAATNLSFGTLASKLAAAMGATGASGWLVGKGIGRALQRASNWVRRKVEKRLSTSQKTKGKNSIVAWVSKTKNIWVNYKYRNPAKPKYHYNFRIGYLGKYPSAPIVRHMRRSRYWVG